MKTIRNNRMEKKVRRSQKFRNWLFRVFKLRKMRKKISKLYYKEQIFHPEPITKLLIYAHVFKYDKHQIERGLKMFVDRGELKEYFPVKKGDSKDAYILVFSLENRSQSRISAEIPDEIDLNSIKVEPILEKQAVESSTEQSTSAESVAEPITDTNSEPF